MPVYALSSSTAFTINHLPALLDLVKISGAVPVVMQGLVHRKELALNLYFTQIV